MSTRGERLHASYQNTGLRTYTIRKPNEVLRLRVVAACWQYACPVLPLATHPIQRRSCPSRYQHRSWCYNLVTV